MWDFTIRERAEQYWQEAHTAAAEQRLLRQATAERPASLLARLARLITRESTSTAAAPVPVAAAARKA